MLSWWAILTTVPHGIGLGTSAPGTLGRTKCITVQGELLHPKEWPLGKPCTERSRKKGEGGGFFPLERNRIADPSLFRVPSQPVRIFHLIHILKAFRVVNPIPDSIHEPESSNFSALLHRNLKTLPFRRHFTDWNLLPNLSVTLKGKLFLISLVLFPKNWIATWSQTLTFVHYKKPIP